METISSASMAIAMIAALLLIWGGIILLRRDNRTKGMLMLAMAAVLVVNVMIWTL